MSVFPGQSVRDRANHVIFRATPLFRTATPSRLRHSLVRIARSTQRESLQPSPSGPEVAHPARCKMASKPSRQPPRGESRKSSLRRVNNADQVALSHSMEHGSGLHHAKVKELLPRAAIHLQPPGADGSLQTCLETVRSEATGQRRWRGGFEHAAIIFWVAPGLHTELAATGSHRHPLATADGGAAASSCAGCTSLARALYAIRVLSSRPHARIVCVCGHPKRLFMASSQRAWQVHPSLSGVWHGERPCELSVSPLTLVRRARAPS